MVIIHPPSCPSCILNHSMFSFYPSRETFLCFLEQSAVAVCISTIRWHCQFLNLFHCPGVVRCISALSPRKPCVAARITRGGSAVQLWKETNFVNLLQASVRNKNMFFNDKCKGQTKNLCSQRDCCSENDTKGDFSLKYLRICKKQSENLTF